MKKFWFVMVIVLIFGGTACNVLSGSDDNGGEENSDGGETAVLPENSTSTDEVTDGIVNNEADNSDSSNVEANEDFLNLDVSNLEPAGVNSYRMLLVYGFEGSQNGEAYSGKTTVQGAQVLDPHAISFTVMGEGNGSAGQAGTFTQIGDTFYANIAEGNCLATTSGQENFQNIYSDMLNGSGALGRLENAKRVLPNETVNGVNTKVYEFDNTSLVTMAGAYSAINGRIYIAADGDYVVRVHMTATGSALGSTDEGTITYDLDFTDFNANIDIPIPAGCEDQATGGGYPMMEDAFETTTMSGMTVYKTNASAADAVTFYKAQLSDWTIGQEMDIGGTANITFTKDGKTINFTATPDPSTGATLISLVGQ